jgi:hypothetical protein
VLCHKHRDELKLKDKWVEIWLKPVIEALDTSTPLHRSLIAEVKTFLILIKKIKNEILVYFTKNSSRSFRIF